MNAHHRLIVLVVVISLLYPFVYWGMYAGDAVIYLVYGRNASEGHYFEYNKGEKSAGATSPAHMLLTASLFFLFPEALVPVILKGLNIVFWYGLLVLVFMLLRSLFSDTRPAYIGMLILALMPGAVHNATVGMENGFFAFFVVLWMWLAVRWEWFSLRATPSFSRELLLGLLLGAASWIRPEGLIVGTVAILCRIFYVGLSTHKTVTVLRRSALSAVPFFVFITGMLAFYFLHTGRLVPCSGAARMLASYQESFRLGCVMFNPKFTIRLACYFPLALLWVLGVRSVCTPDSIINDKGMEIFSLILFTTFFILYSTVLGAAHLARYTIFIMPAMLVGSMRGLLSIWNNSPPTLLLKRPPSRRVILLVLTGCLGLVFAFETHLRLSRGSRTEVHNLMKVPENRRRLSDRLYQQLGNPVPLPVVIACQEVQNRYWLDERFVVRSLDGRVDGVLLRHYHDGILDYIGYIKERNIDYIVDTPNVNRDKTAWGLDRLCALAPGESLRREGITFRRLPGGRAFFRIEHDHKNRKP